MAQANTTVSFALNPHAVGIDAVLNGTLRLAVDIHLHGGSVRRSLVRCLPLELVAALGHESRSERHHKMHALVFLEAEVLVVLVLLFLRPYRTCEWLDDDAQFLQRTLNGLRHTDYRIVFGGNVAHGKLHLKRHCRRRVRFESFKRFVTDDNRSSARNTEHLHAIVILHPGIARTRKAVPHRRHFLLRLLVDDGLEVRLGVVAHLGVKIEVGTCHGRIVVLVIHGEHHKSVSLALTQEVHHLVAVVSEHTQVGLIRGRALARG